ncbi:unknown protein [Seminavis robusta]|uniref:Uncharacterized protein n=1 Tax=Seminavis robusta TaxID=568900 RepID=A0A9N8EJG3_9STRA|nr:unknown protein [Seminavis robusta]|eukprot:Sro1199_g251660.1 n/a (640) ;mRNA; f:742-2661
MMTPRRGIPQVDSLAAIIEDGATPRSRSRGPMTPRHDKPQVNLHTAPPRHPPPRSSSKKKHRKQHIPYDEMDEASKEAHIVQKIELAIKKSKSERKASTRSQASGPKRRDHEPNTPAQHHRQWPEDQDENYQMNKSGGGGNQRGRPRRSGSNKYKVSRHRPKPALEAPRMDPERLKSSLMDLDEQMEHFSEIDGVVDDKRGFQIDVDEQWLSNTFSDPTLDTYEHNHFFGQDKRLGMLDPQRIQCGPGGASTADSSRSAKEPDAVSSIIDRIYEKKEQTGKTYTRKSNHQAKEKKDQRKGNTNHGNAKEEPPKELISFDHYEDDDGYYYEDEEDEYPIYPGSRPPPPRPAMPDVPISMSMNMPSLIGAGITTKTNKESSGAQHSLSSLQAQLDEINQLHRDIQRQQDLIKQVTQLSSREANHQHIRPNPHETSANVYQRELARQAQAELCRMELVQKSMMLEKQMDIYRRNQEEWNKVRDLAIKEEENRRKIVEKAKEVWQAEMRTKLSSEHNDKYANENYASDKFGNGGGGGDTGILPRIVEGNSILEGTSGSKESESKALSKASTESSKESAQQQPLSSEDTDDAPSLYEKVAQLNKRAMITEEDQKIIEAEILRDLHRELSKQVAENVTNKPLFCL